MKRLSGHARLWVLGLCVAASLGLWVVFSPVFSVQARLAGLVLEAAPLFVAALGAATLLAFRQLDLSVGAQLAAGTALAASLARAGAPLPWLILSVLVAGALQGAVNGALVGAFRLPSVAVTLATMAGWRWLALPTDPSLPRGFRWAGLSVAAGHAAIGLAALLVLAAFWAARRRLRNDGPRFSTARPSRVTFLLFVSAGALTAAAALLAVLQLPRLAPEASPAFEVSVLAVAVAAGAAGGRVSLPAMVLATLLVTVLDGAFGRSGMNLRLEMAVPGLTILVALAAERLRRGKLVDD